MSGICAITGCGVVCAAGLRLEEAWEGLAAARVDCAPAPGWLFATGLSCPVFVCPCEVVPDGSDEWLAAGAVPPGASRTVRLAFAAAAQGLGQAGLSPDELRGRKVGVVLGTTVGCTFHDEEYFLAWRGGREPDLGPVRSFLGNNVAQALHRLLGTSGPAFVVTNACASATDAIGIAAQWLASGRCDLAIAGGADELSRVALNGFTSLMLTSDAPCRPYDRERSGLNLGEGAGVLVLEPEKTAAGRAIGRVLGYGCAADAWHPTAPHPEGRGLAAALNDALARAGRPEIALINGHGTGTRANDQAETAALAAVFGNSAVPLVSTKGITGHTLGAAGGVEAVFTLESLRRGETFGSVGCRTPDPELPYAPLPEGGRAPLRSRTGISQSLAFGGTNSVLVMEAL